MDPRESFRRNDWPTLGVEVELQLVDARSMALKSAIADLLAELPADLHDSVKPEFLQCYVEVNTGVCRTVADVGADLDGKIRAVERAADHCGVGLFWGGTHPFSHWRDQEITPNERYYKLANVLGETVVRPVTFGLHVHVGVVSGDAAIRVGDRLQQYLPLLLAFSANSPFWNGRRTGDHAHRIGLLEGFPTGGLPPRMRSWNEYQLLFRSLKEAGFIESPKEIWWDVRPCPENGTVEVRICDMPPDLPSVLGLTALIQCLVAELSERLDGDAPDSGSHSLLVRQNRWRACRFGPGAALVDPTTLEVSPARQAAEKLAVRLRPVAERLGCVRQLENVLDLAAGPTGSERQMALCDEVGDLAEMVRQLVGKSRLGAAGFPVAAHAPGLVTPLAGDGAMSPCRFAAQTAAHSL
jgi:carboxylate-amine ligase